jgi:DNA-binding CsgD family transcriptional regulator
VELVQTDVRRALELALEWHEAPCHDALLHQSIEGLNELIGVDATGWNMLDLAEGKLEVIAYPESATFTRDLPLLEALIEQHPLVPYVVSRPLDPPITHSDVISQRELERRQIYQDFFRPHEIRHQMAFVFSVEPFIAVAMNRRDHDFTLRQRELAGMLQPHLGSAYRAIAERERARQRLEALERGLELSAGAVILLSGHGRIEHCSPAARELLTTWFATTECDRLPHALIGLRGARRFRRPSVELLVSAIDTDPPLLLLDERRVRPEPERIRRLGLTSREGEVLSAVAAGLSDAEIAEELFISARTVQKHLEHIYRKLGVTDRDAAAACALGADRGGFSA